MAEETQVETTEEAQVEETTDPETPVEETVEKPDLSTDLAAVERDRCKKIRALCELAGTQDKFNLFVDNNFSVEETQAALRDIVAKKNPALSNSPEPQKSDPDASLRAEYAEAVKFKVTMGLSEAEYIANAKKAKA